MRTVTTDGTKIVLTQNQLEVLITMMESKSISKDVPHIKFFAIRRLAVTMAYDYLGVKYNNITHDVSIFGVTESLGEHEVANRLERMREEISLFVSDAKEVLVSAQSARVDYNPIATPNAFGDVSQVPDIRVTVSLDYIESFVDKVMSIATGVKWNIRERMAGV